MTDTDVVRHRPDAADGDPAPLVDWQLADELLAGAQAQGVANRPVYLAIGIAGEGVKGAWAGSATVVHRLL